MSSMSSVTMSSVSMSFNASVYVSEQMNRQMINMAQDLAHRCITECAVRYGFDAEEAVRLLGLAMIKVERKVPIKAKTVKAEKAETEKPSFPLPYSGEFNDKCCYALRQNNGLYTQCSGIRRNDGKFCKGCSTTMQKSGAEVPEYGTIQQRMEADIFEFTDPKGRKPIAYTKIMKKYKISEEQVLAEASKLNITVNPSHFVAPAEESKRGRPKAEKEPKVKGSKGRPKKEKKVLMIEGDDEDLFATLIAEANEDSEELTLAPKSSADAKKKSGKSEEEKESERLAKEAEKEAKRLAAEEAKAEKEAKLAAEKAEKEAKKEQERLARELKKKQEEEEKIAKKLAVEQAKAEKEAKLAAEKAAKALAQQSKSSKKAAAEPVEEEEQERVKKIEYEGKKYLKSLKTGIIYDYEMYHKEGEQVVIGNWSNELNKIIFNAQEEEEEEYDM